MLRITQPPATAAVMAEHPVATVGRYLVRYALVVVIAWIGALKYTGYEAAGIQPLIAHSPIFSWLYSILSVRAFAAVLGSLEILAALLIAIRPLAPRISVIGSVMGILLFLGTLSFLFTTPGVRHCLCGEPDWRTVVRACVAVMGRAPEVAGDPPGRRRRDAEHQRAWRRAARVTAADRAHPAGHGDHA